MVQGEKTVSDGKAEGKKYAGAEEIRTAAKKARENMFENLGLLTETVATVVGRVEERQEAIDGEQKSIARRLTNQEGLGGTNSEEIRKLREETLGTGKETDSLAMRLMELDQHVRNDVDKRATGIEEELGKTASKASVEEVRNDVEGALGEARAAKAGLSEMLTREEAGKTYLPKSELDSFNGRCEAVEKALEKVEKALKKNESAAPKGVEDELKKLREELNGVKTNVKLEETLAVASELEKVKKKLGEIENQSRAPTQVVSEVPSEKMREIDDKITSLRNDLASSKLVARMPALSVLHKLASRIQMETSDKNVRELAAELMDATKEELAKAPKGFVHGEEIIPISPEDLKKQIIAELKPTETPDVKKLVEDAIKGVIPEIVKQVAGQITNGTANAAVDTDAIIKQTYATVLRAVGGLAKNSADTQELGEAIEAEIESLEGEK